MSHILLKYHRLISRSQAAPGPIFFRGRAYDLSLLITVVRGRRRRPLSQPNYRRRSGNYRRLRSSALYASSAFFIMTLVD